MTLESLSRSFFTYTFSPLFLSSFLQELLEGVGPGHLSTGLLILPSVLAAIGGSFLWEEVTVLAITAFVFVLFFNSSDFSLSLFTFLQPEKGRYCKKICLNFGSSSFP